MKKKHCIILQMILLAWFFLDIVGLRLGDKYLVMRSYADDGIFFIIYLISMLLFIYKERIGKWVITGWMSLWFLTQFLSHEWYTIFNNGIMGAIEDKIKYFSGTIQLLNIDGRYVPDLYHIILYILILTVLIAAIRYIKKSKKDC